MPQWMNMPNLASRHHFMRASCWAFVSAGLGGSAAQATRGRPTNWAAPAPRSAASRTGKTAEGVAEPRMSWSSTFLAEYGGLSAPGHYPEYSSEERQTRPVEDR